ncbi:MAG TPA: flavin reductase family protein [archaeon]|nr:flavin reductase family protein [archaeon]
MKIEPKNVNKLLLPRLLTLITSNDEGGGISAVPSDTVIPVSSNPGMVVVTISPAYRILQDILSSKEFVINVLSKDYLNKMLNCVKNYPKGIDELDQVGLNHYSSQKIKAKRVKEAMLWIECRLVNNLKVGENTLLVGEVVTIEAHDSVMDKGEVSLVKINPPIRLAENNFSGMDRVA